MPPVAKPFALAVALAVASPSSRPRGRGVRWSMREVARASHPVLAFGAGAGGEVYVLTWGGPILRLELPP